MSGQAPFNRRGMVVRLCALALLCCPSLRAEVQIERIFMPLDASPSSFAVALPGGVNFCFDPVRCSLSYAWTGGFLDVSPARPGPGKFITAAKLLGPLAYQETGVAPLRRGDPARVPTVEFAGYTLRADGIEFRYTIDGVGVREEITARPHGAGLRRRLFMEGGTDAKWWQVVEGRPAAEIARDVTGAWIIDLPFQKAAQ